MGLHNFPGPVRGNRQLNRLRLGVPAQLVLTHDSRQCLIDDICATGARLRIEGRIGEGQSLVLAFHELRVFAVIKWARGGECGLRFETALDPEDMRGMLWITENRELYNRICREGAAMDWADGIGD